MMKLSTLSTFLVTAALVLVFLLIWAGSVVLVSWDTRRRKVNRWERWLWIALSVGVPIAGSLAYWMILLIARGMKPSPAAPENPKQRVTQSMPAFHVPGGDAIKARSTLPASEMAQPTIPFSAIEPPNQPRPRVNPRAYQITIVEGPNAGADIRLNGFPVGVGRSSAAFVRLENDLNVSRQHAEIYEGPEALHIRDLGSLHGTRVNGRTVQDQALRSGDHIQIGESVLVFQVIEG